jgi:hypothetical protein
LHDLYFPLKGRVIAITSRFWDHLGEHFAEHLSAVCDICDKNNLHFLTDIINSNKVGYTPTIVNFHLYKDEDGSCAIKFNRDGADGPLQYLFNTALLYNQEQSLGNFEIISNEFHQAIRLLDAEERRKKLISIAKELLPVSEKHGPSLLSIFFNIVKDSLRNWEEPSKIISPESPFPIHIHLWCSDADMFSIPIDLIMRGDIPMDHICTQLPVVWRIKINAWKCGPRYDERLSNRVSYKSFIGIHSCSKKSESEDGSSFGPVRKGHEKISKILKHIGKEYDQPMYVKTSCELRKLIIQSLDNNERIIHIISHGVHAEPADCSSILVGPDDEGKAELVTANRLSPDNDEQRGPNFVYFNCCELGHHVSSKNSYTGGFAVGAIMSGICCEIISNRWAARQGWAHKIESEFYKTKPCVVQSRSVALLRARLKVKELMKNSTLNEQYEPTWLAPIHIWADPH